MAASPIAASSSQTIFKPECIACLEEFTTEGAHVPVKAGIEECTHIICLDCFSNMKTNKCRETNKESKSCPECRREWSLTPTHDFPYIHLLENYLNLSKKYEDSDKEICSLQQQLVEEKEARASLIRRTQELQTTIVDLNREISERTQRIEELQGQISELTATNVSRFNVINEQQHELNDRIETIRRQTELIAQLRSHSNKPADPGVLPIPAAQPEPEIENDEGVFAKMGRKIKLFFARNLTPCFFSDTVRNQLIYQDDLIDFRRHQAEAYRAERRLDRFRQRDIIE